MGFSLRKLQTAKEILQSVLEIEFIESYLEGTKIIKENPSHSSTESILLKRQEKEDKLNACLFEMTDEVSDTEKAMNQEDPNFMKDYFEQQRVIINEMFSRDSIILIIEKYNNNTSIIPPIDLKYFNGYWKFVTSLLKKVDNDIANYIENYLNDKPAKSNTGNPFALEWTDPSDIHQNNKVKNLSRQLAERGYIENNVRSKNGFVNLFINNNIAPINWTAEISYLVYLFFLLIEQKKKIIMPTRPWAIIKTYFTINSQPIEADLRQLYNGFKNNKVSSASDIDFQNIFSEIIL